MIQREATIGQLLFHTSHCILLQTHPTESFTSSERLRALQLHHAYQVCGIVAHTTDRGVAIVAIRCLAIAASVLTNPTEQSEVLEILERINNKNGLRYFPPNLSCSFPHRLLRPTHPGRQKRKASTTPMHPLLD